MFEVHCLSTLDEKWEERDEEMSQLAGGKGKTTYTASKGGPKTVEHLWMTRSLKEAQQLKRNLEALGYARVTIKEE